MKFLSVSWTLFLLLVSVRADAVVVNLDTLLTLDPSHPAILNFKKTTELQIGGSHNYGNRTVLKGSNELNPEILIVNPDPEAHFHKTRIPSLIASGFDPVFLNKLSQVCQKFQHRFKKIYINNLGFILPILDQVKVQDLTGRKYFLSERQQETFKNHASANINDKLDEYLYLYAAILFSEVHQQIYRSLDGKRIPNLYSFYFDLLEDEGTFLFKSASLRILSATLFKGVLSYAALDQAKLNLLLKEFDPTQHKFFPALPLLPEIEKWVQEIQTRIQVIGSKFFFKGDNVVMNFELQWDPWATLKISHYLLSKTGFNSVTTYVGKFRDWTNYPEEPKSDTDGAYSIVIQAKKPGKSPTK